MGIKIGIPALDGCELTMECIDYLSRNSVIPESVQIFVFDNGSSESYPADFPKRFSRIFVSLTRISENIGYYQPLALVASAATRADIVGLMHNDLFIYERGWDRRLLDAFLENPRLGMVGVCGSDEIDDRGGRGGGTMCNFAGQVGQLQEHTGKRVTGLHPALILDSMFMAVRQPIVDVLQIDDHVAPCHFYDKIWPLMTIKAGYSVGVLGLQVDHQGGLSTTGSVFEEYCAKWCKKEGLEFEFGKAGQAVYFEAERRFLTYAMSIGKLPSRL